MYKIIWTPESETTFSETLDHLEKRWPSYVMLNFLDRVEQVLDLIAENPLLYPVARKDKQIHRCVVVKQITLFYKIKPGQIDLLSFWNNYKDPESLKL